MSRRLASAALLTAGMCFVSRVAQAAPQFELLGSTLGSGGFSARATGADSASAYFNPARLARAKPGIELGWFILNDAIDLTLFARDPAVDVPEAALNEFEGKFPSIPTAWLQDGCDPAMGSRCVTKLSARPRQGNGSSGNTHVYQVFGLVTEVVPRWLTLSVYGMVPFDSFMKGQQFFVDEREQFFTNSLHPELYSDRLTAMALAFGAGSQVTDWLALGIGVTLSLTNTAEAGTYVGNSNAIGETLLLDTNIKVAAGITPNFGAVLTLLEGLDVSVTVHALQKMEISTGFGTFLPNGDLQHADRKATLAWEPWKFGLGAQYDFMRSAEHRLGVVLSATYALWSDYVDRQSQRPQQGYEWSDTIGLTLGLRYVYAERLNFGLDATYQPSPVPPQTGRTNYVDNDRYAFGGSVNYNINLAQTMSLRLGIQGQVHILPQRSQTKIDPKRPPYNDGRSYSQLVQDEWVDGAMNNRDEVLEGSFGLQTNNPGWPGFSSQGMIVGGGLNVALLY